MEHPRKSSPTTVHNSFMQSLKSSVSIGKSDWANLHPRYPQGIGQAEATNKTIVTSLKKRLKGKREAGPPSFPESYGDTEQYHELQPEKPLSCLSAEWKQESSLKSKYQASEGNTQTITKNWTQKWHELDFIEEKRDRARIRTANYQYAAVQY